MTKDYNPNLSWKLWKRGLAGESKEARSSPLEKQTMQNTDSANENDARLQSASWFLIVSMKCQNKQAQNKNEKCQAHDFPPSWSVLILQMPVYTLKSVLRLLFQRVLQGQQNLRLQIKKK